MNDEDWKLYKEVAIKSANGYDFTYCTYIPKEVNKPAAQNRVIPNQR